MSNKLQLALLVAILASVAFTFEFGTGYSNGVSIIPTDQNFTLDTFYGDWNIVAAYGVDGITNRSCPTLKAKKQPLNTATISITATNVSNSAYVSASKVYQQSKSNKGILVDLLTLKQPQDLAVSYYNETLGQAILINVNSLFALALSKAQDVNDNNFLQTINSIFGEAQLPLSETYFTSQYGCSSNLTTALDFNASAFPGSYYGNAIFMASGAPQNLSCFSVQVQRNAMQTNIYNISYFFQYANSSTNASASYVPSAPSNAFLINIDSPVTVSIVVNHYDAGDDMYVLLANDASVGYVISTKPVVEESTIKYIQNIMTRDGLVINDQTFYAPSDLCPASSETLIEF